MPAFTQEQAQAYYNTLTPEQKAQLVGGPTVEWFTNAVNAGVPEAIKAAGGKAGAPEGGDQGGYTLDWTDAADPSEWLGKRAPTPAELRKWAAQQHAAYVGGDKSSQDEDYARFSDRVLADQIARGWNVESGGWNQGWGAPGSGVPGQPINPAGNGGGGGGGWGNGGGGWGNGGGQNWGPWGPTYEQAASEPGYQFAVDEGRRMLEQSAAAGGLLRSGGTLRDLIDYGQNAGATQYQNVWNRWYAPWQTQYQGNLQKYLQRENNIYGLLNSPPPWAYGAY